jgi:hypothetical protein
MEGGDAPNVQTGVLGPVTVTVTLAMGPSPLPLMPFTEYVVVDAGETVPLKAALEKPALGDQRYDVAAGLQLAVSVEVPPEAMEAGDAARVQTGVCAWVVDAQTRKTSANQKVRQRSLMMNVPAANST